jgi:hypothetical protein
MTGRDDVDRITLAASAVGKIYRPFTVHLQAGERSLLRRAFVVS